MKRTKNLSGILIFAITAWLFTGCTSENDMVPGTGDGTVGMLFKLQPASGSAANARNANTGLLFTDGFIQIKELELDLEGNFNRDGLISGGSFDDDDDDEDGSEWEYEVEFNEIKKVGFDQFDTETDFFINIPEGEYEEIEMEIDLIDYRNEPSILLNGTYMNAEGEEISFRFELFGDDIDFEVEIEADDDNYFVVDRVNNPLILFELVPERWFSSISTSELENAELDDDGVMVFSESSNRSIFQKVRERIATDAEIEIEID
ncbi:hypothetical protein [Cyclobacterium sp.]|uniref:hypothetical protein n=1 Tax=Cyclobacterium sp. TaxID=1966343 RepID=UPI0019A13E55|nr:hypothetical protein [Cyclobacterium sp.]MBD3627277.1 hypothetical protein [Cyclobacterium sp.]